MLTKLTPQMTAEAIRLEQVVIGAAIRKNSLIGTIDIEEADFSEPLHREIWREMTGQHAAGREISKITLGVTFAAEVPISESCTVPEYIRRLELAGFDFSQSAPLTLKAMSSRRSLRHLGEMLVYLADDRQATPRETAADAVAQLDGILSRSKERKTVKTYDLALREAMEEIANPKPSQRATTGLQGLDQVVGGYQRGQFWILAGRPSMGKSSIALSSLIRTARSGHGVMLFSLEMPTHEIAVRSISDVAWSTQRAIPYSRALAGQLSDGQLDYWARAAAMVQGLPLVIDDQRGLTVSEIAVRARAQKAQLEADGLSLDLVVVDHLGLVKPSGRYAGNKVNEVGEISDGLATLARELDCCVLALSQLNRGVEGRENKRPQLSDLRNSGDIEQDAHVVMFAYRQAYYLERAQFEPGSQQEMERLAKLEALKNTIEIGVAKNRNGPTETVFAFGELSCNAIRDMRP